MAADLIASMTIFLSHKLAESKLLTNKDEMVIMNAAPLVRELEKQLNTYGNRVREWYSEHFPEMGRYIPDQMNYVKAILLMKERSNAAHTNFSEILAEGLEADLKKEAVTSIGAEISETDLTQITDLCEQFILLSGFRATMVDEIRAKMKIIAPALTAEVGELLGARLIFLGGGLMKLCEMPASRIQTLGAGKELVEAFKSKIAKPEYKLIYETSLLSQASQVQQAARRRRGKVSRTLAAKCALAARKDALGGNKYDTLGLVYRACVTRELSFASKEEGKPRRNPRLNPLVYPPLL